MAKEPITSDNHQQLMLDFGVDAPQIGEKNITLVNGILVRDENNDDKTYFHWEVIHRADETYWSPLDGDRKTLYDITAYKIQNNQNSQWITIEEWFKLDKF
ncbi:hypothetical protein [Weissella hellenica]|uniref:Uncharacterized protein n=1 Tax=Weissella hellenica TaxID=46256 RepID=A0A4Y4G8I7_WEIHE|nr:hypothetical protein [Weissella hellenica]NKY67517.1 hypothetical protein [Weissella hellenica]GED36490.1 hypothetical protein WHE01_13940 [Weissella hellenica]SCC09605.1 hypothetical protein GA0061075_11564 [Weissella hellenica]